MSDTYSIGCSKCKLHMWIAQAPCGHPENGYLYTAHDDRIYAFLQAHRGHPLVFDDNTQGDSEIQDWQEVDLETGDLIEENDEQPH